MSTSDNVYKVTILPNGAIPTEFLEHNKNNKKEDDLKTQMDKLIEDVIILKKQLRRAIRERDAYRQYVPQELLTMGNIVRHTPSPQEGIETMTDDP